MSEKKTVWVAYTNTDRTEGRGYDVPIAICALEITAKRLARNRYVQGSDGPVRPMELILIDNEWYAPERAITVELPTVEDIAEQESINAKQIAIEKAKAAGLTDDDLAALSFNV